MPSDDDRFFWLERNNTKHELPDGNYMAQFYENISKPYYIACLFITLFAISYPKLSAGFESLARGDDEGILFGFLFVFTSVVGLRLINSCVLAKRDYSCLESNIAMDIIYFLALITFTSGFVIVSVFSLNIATLREKISVIVAIYAFLAFVGLINFYDLWKRRLIKRSKKEIDIEIELRIQLYNVFVFLFIVIQLTSTFFIIRFRFLDDYIAGILFVSSIILLIINIYISTVLTNRPKFLLHNSKDKQADNELLERAYKLIENAPDLKKLNHQDLYKKDIKLIRATRDDIPMITKELIRYFGYMFEYVFNESEPKKLEKLIGNLLLCASGLGPHGYLNYYFIVDNNIDEENKVGFLKLDCDGTSLLLYNIWYKISFFLCLIRCVGFGNSFDSLRRSKIVNNNRQYRFNDLELTYLVIFKKYHRKGYGESTVKLLKRALVENRTDRMSFEQIRTITREKNKGGVSFFNNSSFSQYIDCIYNEELDPLIFRKDVGKQFFFKLM